MYLIKGIEIILKRKYSPIKDIDKYVIEEKEKLNKEKLFLQMK